LLLSFLLDSLVFAVLVSLCLLAELFVIDLFSLFLGRPTEFLFFDWLLLLLDDLLPWF